MATLKDNIQHEVCLWEPDSLEKAFTLVRKIGSEVMEKRNPTTQAVKYDIEKEEMNPTIYFNALEEITTPQTLKIEGHIKKKKIQAMKYHIEHQQQFIQLLKDNDTLLQNRMKTGHINIAVKEVLM